MQQPDTLNYSAWQLIRDLWHWLGPNKWRFVAASIARAFSELIFLYPPLALSQIVTFLTHYQPGQNLNQLLIIIGLWATVLLIRIPTREWSRLIAETISDQTALSAELVGFRHLFSLDLGWHEQSNTGNKLKRLQNGSQGIHDLFQLWSDNIIATIILIGGVIVILATLDTITALSMTIFALTYFPLTIILTQKAAAASHQVNLAEEDVSGLTFEAIGNIRSVKVLGMAQALIGLTERAIATLYGKMQERIRRFRIRELILQFYQQFFNLIIVLFAVWQVLHGQAAIGLLILIAEYFRRINKSVSDIGDNTRQLLIAKYAVGRLQQLLREKTINHENTTTHKMPKAWKQIVLEDVTFAYGETEVLHTISLTIKRGQKIGIVGISGAGKSTLFKLLLKEYENYTGQILVDSTPLAQIRRDSYAKHSAVVLQDTEVFNFSLRDNIALANWQQRANTKLLDQASEIAHVTDFMNRLPDGFETKIGEKGIRLSGGEKQRVGIARAVFKQPEILFMDEATSHLDSESEAKIQDSLHTFFKSVTAVVIAHRLSTIRQMDCIYVLEHGSIVESGSFKGLIAAKGRFSQMWKRQQF